MPSQRARYLTATHEPRLSLGLELALSVAGDLGQQVPGAVDEAALPQALRQDGLHRADQPGAAVGDDEQRWPQPTLEHPAQEGGPGGGRLAGARLQAEQVGLAGRGETPATSTGSADAPGCIRKWLPSRERYSSSIGDRSAAVAVELGLDHLTDAAHHGARDGRLRTERLSWAGFHVAHGGAPHEAGDDQRLQGVGLGHSAAEQARGERHARAAQLGARPRRTGPAVVLIVSGA